MGYTGGQISSLGFPCSAHLYVRFYLIAFDVKTSIAKKYIAMQHALMLFLRNRFHFFCTILATISNYKFHTFFAIVLALRRLR